MLPVANSSLGPKAKQSIGVEEVAGWWQGRRKRINKDQLRAVSKPWLSRRLVIATSQESDRQAWLVNVLEGADNVLNSKPFHVAIERYWKWMIFKFNVLVLQILYVMQHGAFWGLLDERRGVHSKFVADGWPPSPGPQWPKNPKTAAIFDTSTLRLARELE